MIPVIMSVDRIAQRFVGERAHMLHETLGHRPVDLRVDHGAGLVSQDNDAIDNMAKQIHTLGNTFERAIRTTSKRIHSLLSSQANCCVQHLAPPNWVLRTAIDAASRAG